MYVPKCTCVTSLQVLVSKIYKYTKGLYTKVSRETVLLC